MAGTSQFTIGTGVGCGDGAVGKVSRVIIDPAQESQFIPATSDEVQDLPPVDIDHPDRSTSS
jgi:hypothetical protein